MHTYMLRKASEVSTLGLLHQMLDRILHVLEDDH